MSDIQLYLIEVGKNKDEARRLAGVTVSKLVQKHVQLLEVIESVGEYINDEDDTTRARSLAYLADVLEQLPPRVLALRQRLVLTEFLLSRIADDSTSVPPSARSLIALESMAKWDNATANKIMTTIIETTSPLKQFKLQAERYTILKLIDLLLAKYRQPVSERAQDDFDFIARFVEFFEGEKDPRNLMIIFSVVLVPMAEWTLGPSTQDMFDLVFNYFPITFKAPPGDPYGISAQDLKDRLRACIVSTSDFAPYAFPALLDKLDSSSMNTKRDVLQALVSCIASYEPRTISLYSVTLWDALKFEILNVQEEDLAETSLEALAAIASSLSQASEGALTAFLKPIVKECNEHLEDAPTKQSVAASRVLYSIARTSPGVCDSVIKGIMPTLIALFKSSDSIARRRGLVEVMDKLLQAVNVASAQWQVRDDAGNIIADHAKSHAFRAYTDDALDFLLQAVNNAPKSEVSFRLFSLQALKDIVVIRELVDEGVAVRILSACTDIIIHETETVSDEILAAALQTIISAAQEFPKPATENALPTLLAQLPDVPEAGIFTYESALEVLAKLSVDFTLANTIIIRLKNKLDTAKRQHAPQTYILALLGALLYVFTHGSPEKEDGVIKITYLTDIVLPWLLEATSDSSSPLHNEVCTDLVSRLLNLILRDQRQHVQNQIYSQLEELFSHIATTSTPMSGNVPGSALNVIPALYTFAALRTDVFDGQPPISTLHAVSRIANDHTVSRTSRMYALRYLTILINKFVPPKALDEILRDWQPALTPVSTHSSKESAEILSAISKGAILRGKNNPLMEDVLGQLFGQFSADETGLAVAYSIGAIFAGDELVDKRNHCTISGLFKQRTFGQCAAFVREGVQSTSGATKRNYLIALGEILRNVPYDLVSSGIDTLVPLVLQILDLKDSAHASSKSSALITTEAILMHDAAKLNEHAASVIARLLESISPAANAASVRIAALRCLKIVPEQLKRETVIPYRRQVIKRLLEGLDDSQRAVRGEAVRCRGAWLDLEKEDEDDE